MPTSQTVPNAFGLGVAAAAAGLVAITVRAYAVGAARPPLHRFLTVLAGVLCTGGVSLLAAGAVDVGSAAVGLAVEAFFCSVVFVGPSPGPQEGDDLGGGGGGGPGSPPRGDPGGGDGLDWEGFERDFEAHVREQDPATL